MLLSWANTHFYQDLMAEIRASIREGRFRGLAERVRAAYPPGTVEGDDAATEARPA